MKIMRAYRSLCQRRQCFINNLFKFSSIKNITGNHITIQELGKKIPVCSFIPLIIILSVKHLYLNLGNFISKF